MTTKYSLEEVRKHNGKSSCWLVIHENVYDVTKFMEEVSGDFNVWQNKYMLNKCKKNNG